MLTKVDLEKLAQLRLDDAKLLLNSGRASSAYYLAGYAVELGLKVCISKQMQADVIPDKRFIQDIYTHDLASLLGLAGLRPQFEADGKANSQLTAAWAIVTKWNEASRYEFWDSVSAALLVNAVGDPINGVFQWVKKHW
jgi:HEPN domain-containing protein